MTRWFVTLDGPKADLEKLIEWSDGEDWNITHHEKWGVVLCGPRLEAAADVHEIQRTAEELIGHINRAAKHLDIDLKGVKGKDFIEQDRVVTPIEVAEEVDEALPIALTKEEQARRFHRLMILQKRNSNIADALWYLAHDPDQRLLYMAAEAILAAIGEKKSNWNAFVRHRWTTREQWSLFDGSIQKERHHNEPGPREPMTVREARAYVQMLLDKAAEHLDPQGRPGGNARCPRPRRSGRSMARVLEQLQDRFPGAAELLIVAADDLLAFTAFPSEHWRQI